MSYPTQGSYPTPTTEATYEPPPWVCPNKRADEAQAAADPGKPPVKKRPIPHGENMGDWPCRNDQCDNYNFQRRYKCNKCGTPRFEPKLTDWKCWCGNYNDFHLTKCNECRSDKPVENRFGKGGGFNERENVTYKKRAEDEDEKYDDLGRLIKKKKDKEGSKDKDGRSERDDDRGSRRERSRGEDKGSRSDRRRSRSRSRDRHR